MRFEMQKRGGVGGEKPWTLPRPDFQTATDIIQHEPICFSVTVSVGGARLLFFLEPLEGSLLLWFRVVPTVMACRYMRLPP